MKLTPITAFRSVTTTRVLPPKPKPRPGVYASAVKYLVSKGRTPEQAMRELEAKDGHFGRVPCTKVSTTTADMILPHLTHEWQVLTPAFCELVGAAHDTIRMSLKMMITAGLVEQRKTMINKPSQWRLV